MKIIDHPEFNPEFPEQFNWDAADSRSLSEFAANVCAEIRMDLNTPNRALVPGLRCALRELARVATL